jgi:hypothetical protein
MLTREEVKMIPEIEWFHWKEGSGPGLVQVDKGRTIAELCGDIEKALKQFNLYDELYWLSMEKEDADKEVPVDTRRIAVYAIKGGSEGYLVYVEARTPKETIKICSMKILSNFKTALQIAEILTYAFWE